MVIVSHVTDKAKKKITENLNEQIWKIEHTRNQKERVQQINRLNSMTMGIHEFYSPATNISEDLTDINKGFRLRLYNRILKGQKDPKKGS